MAHYAKIGLDLRVMTVVVVADVNCQNANGVEDEEVGRQFLEQCFGWPNWVKCSYNTHQGIHREGGTPFRKNFPGVGFIWDSNRNAFYHPKPHDSWVLNEDTCTWESPIVYPSVTTYGDNHPYDISWDENNLRWIAKDHSVPQNSFRWDVDTTSWVAIQL